MIRKKIVPAVVLSLLLAAPLFSAHYRVIYSFASRQGPAEEFPCGSLVTDGSSLYGVSPAGGAKGNGTIYALKIDGTGYRILHLFGGYPSDGLNPRGKLVLAGTWLYGVTSRGGASDVGVIYKLKTDGTGFVLLHSFNRQDGMEPIGALTLSGSWLYGATDWGGADFLGVIFKIKIDGTGFTMLHSFIGSPTEGEGPLGSLLLAGSTLWGLTRFGGAFNRGCIFKINTDGSGFGMVHNFWDWLNDGYYPLGSLISNGNSHYGMTSSGGENDWGTVFKINTDGSGYTLLHSFDWGPSAVTGSGPVDSLTWVQSKLYGLAYHGGTYGGGVMFELAPDGTGYRVLHSFSGGTVDGYYPAGTLEWGGTRMFGTTLLGGHFGWGTVFSYDLPAADIALSKSSDNLTPAQGSTFDFTVTATNKGPDPATGLKVKDVLPGRLSHVSSSASQGAYKPGSGVWTIGTLAKGAEAILTITVRAVSAGMAKNIAVESALNELDLVASNNSASVTISIAPKLAAAKIK